MEAKIRKQVEQLKLQRETFVTQANLQIAAFNGAIQQLELLLQPDPPAETPAPPQGEVAAGARACIDDASPRPELDAIPQVAAESDGRLSVVAPNEAEGAKNGNAQPAA